MDSNFGFLSRFLFYSIQDLPYVIISLIIAFTVHEFSHAYFANKFGDPTAKNQGRLTLNPAAHLDPFGTIMILLIGVGWAKPVPVNAFHFKNKRLAGIVVSVAGPLSNLLVATIAMAIWFALQRLGIINNIGTTNYTLYTVLLQLFNMLIYLNLILFIFNLLPIPPLDGYRIIEDLVPRDLRPKLIQWEAYGSFVFMLMLFTPLDKYVFGPIFNTIYPVVFQSLQNTFLLLFGL